MNEFYEINATKTMPDGSRYIGLPESAICKELRNGDSMVKIVYLRRTGIDTKIEIENILYDLDKWDIRPDAAIELDKIVSLLRQYPTMEIELGSHTDCRGTVNYNDDLSSKRAASCAEYIVSRGVAPIRLSSRGYGESQLKNGCACEGNIKSTCSEADHQKNRRTESKIIKF
jgi:outer membrane protein OmpA-like peptidoglycan-associated protein